MYTFSGTNPKTIEAREFEVFELVEYKHHESIWVMATGVTEVYRFQGMPAIGTGHDDIQECGKLRGRHPSGRAAIDDNI